MDVHCCNCGEPWDQYFLRHELKNMTVEELSSEGWEFGQSRLVVLHCPGCPKDGSSLPNAEERKRAVREIAQLLGEDEDGLAATLEDFDL